MQTRTLFVISASLPAQLAEITSRSGTFVTPAPSSTAVERVDLVPQITLRLRFACEAGDVDVRTPLVNSGVIA